MKLIFKNAFVLFAITLVAGIFLGLVYEVTKAPRAAQIEKVKQEAYRNVFSEADSFEEIEFNMDDISKYLKEKEITEKVAIVNEVAKALDTGGNELGYVITVTSKEGYAGDIQLSVGITNEGHLNGISVLTISETAGLGMKAASPEFTNQYEDKTVDSFVTTKNGAVEDNEIDAISGATITTDAMTNAVNTGIFSFNYLNGGGSLE